MLRAERSAGALRACSAPRPAPAPHELRAALDPPYAAKCCICGHASSCTQENAVFCSNPPYARAGAGAGGGFGPRAGAHAGRRGLRCTRGRGRGRNARHRVRRQTGLRCTRGRCRARAAGPGGGSGARTAAGQAEALVHARARGQTRTLVRARAQAHDAGPEGMPARMCVLARSRTLAWMRPSRFKRSRERPTPAPTGTRAAPTAPAATPRRRDRRLPAPLRRRAPARTGATR